MRKDASLVEHGIVGFDFVRASRSLFDKQDPQFMYFQLLKGILLNFKDVEELTDMNAYCELQRTLNSHLSNSIAAFQERYSERSPIDWYTRDSFVYSMTNRGLRTSEILQLSTEQKALLKEPLILYRGVRCSNAK